MAKLRTFRHLNQADRDRIEPMINAGIAQKDIASVLGIHPSSISREINKRKGLDGRYLSTRAEQKAANKRRFSKYQGMKVEQYPQLRKRIILELKQRQTPDGIAGRLREEGILPRVSADAIYRWLYSVYGQRYCQYLCSQRRRPKLQKKTESKPRIPNMVSIHDISDSYEIRTEGDTFLSPKKVSKASVALVVWQDCKLIKGAKVKSLKPVHTTKVMRKIHRECKSDLLILDQGIENLRHEEFGVKTCFCDPASPRQKPLIESSIGLCRRWFWPKGTNLSKVTEEELQTNLEILNNKYRKSLNYRSANEVAREYGII